MFTNNTVKLFIIGSFAALQHTNAASLESKEIAGEERIARIFHIASVSTYPDGNDILLEEGSEVKTMGEKPLDIDLSNDFSSPRQSYTTEDLQSLVPFAPMIYGLSLSQACLNNEALIPVSMLTELRELNLTANYFEDKGIIHIDQLRKLEKLILVYNLKISALSLGKIFTKLGDLSYLDLNSCANLGNAGMEKLTLLKKVRYLDVRSCGFNDEALPYFLRMEGLTKLRISRNKISPSALRDFLALAGAKGINVEANDLLSIETGTIITEES
jgi:hypothetical protein